MHFPDEQLWTYNSDTLALINAHTGTALKYGEADGSWQLPKVDGTPDLIEPAFLVLGLSRIANQLWKNESTRLRNIDPKNKITIDLKDEQLWKLNRDGKTLGRNYSLPITKCKNPEI